MIPVNRDHQALTPSCFAVADRLSYPNAVKLRLGRDCRRLCEVRAAISGPAGVCPQVGPPIGLHEGSAAGSILHVACTRAGIPWFDMTWKLNELERPE